MTPFKTLFLALALGALASPALALDVPMAVFPVRDDVGLLDATTMASIQAECARLERATSAQIGVLIIDTTQGVNHHDFAVRVYNTWGVGQLGTNKGVLLLVAMEDRRLEIVPGDGYRYLFDQRTSEELLREVAVPLMRAKLPAQAVKEVVRRLAQRIRQSEGVAPDFDGPPPGMGQVELESTGFGGGQRVDALPSQPLPTSSAPVSSSSGSRSVHSPYTYREESTFGGDFWLIFGIGVLAACWLGFMVYALGTALRTGRLIVPRIVFHLLSWPVLVIGGGLTVLLLLGHSEQGLAVLPGACGVGGAVFGGMTQHLCRRCNKWMSITNRTLVAATYTSSGSGQRTYHCTHCLYHHVEHYSIAQRTKSSSSSYSSGSSSSSSSSSRSSSSRGSFGGGHSSGGGGGASW